jgi:hypothetical protein
METCKQECKKICKKFSGQNKKGEGGQELHEFARKNLDEQQMLGSGGFNKIREIGGGVVDCVSMIKAGLNRV